jgi:hypothetical protein
MDTNQNFDIAKIAGITPNGFSFGMPDPLEAAAAVLMALATKLAGREAALVAVSEYRSLKQEDFMTKTLTITYAERRV